MLDCTKDRLDYGEILQPPEGYELENAIATTYSADLSTVLSIPVALLYKKTLDGDLFGTELQLLDAIERFSERVCVFHQHGRLHVPKAQSRLFAYLESVFVPVHLENQWASFHPKVWLIRFRRESTEARRFRLIVLSRNLTFDRSWDLAAVLDGTVGDSPIEKSTALVEFVRYLRSVVFENRSISCSWLDQFMVHLGCTEFDLPEGFEKFGFHPIGPPFSRTNPALQQNAHEGLVISPFLHRGALSKLRENVAARLDLISDPYELSKLPRSLLHSFDRIWQLREEIVRSELQEDATELQEETRLQQLHAKAFFLWTGENYGRTHLFLGSANATKAADERNIEFLLELECPRSWVSQEKVRGELLTGEGESNDIRPFEAYIPPEKNEPVDDEQQDFRRFEHALLGSDCHAWVEPAATGENYDLQLRLDVENLSSHSGYTVSVRPLIVAKGYPAASVTLGGVNQLVFRGISKVDLCRFFVFRTTKEEESGFAQEFVRFIEVGGLPDDRLAAITRKIIDSREKFFAYLRFLISAEIRKEDLLSTIEERPFPEAVGSEGSPSMYSNLAVFEEILVAASRDPAKITRASQIISELYQWQMEDEKGESVVPPEFAEFWKAFEDHTV
jgi:hypothetical protein